MKTILASILVVILLIFGINQYQDYQRFHNPNNHYQPVDGILRTDFNKSLVNDYLKSITNLNGYMELQWSTNGIDVRNPQKDDTQNQYASNQYNNLLSEVKFLENQLLQIQKLKNEGKSNQEIELLIKEQKTAKQIKKEQEQLSYKNTLIEIYNSKTKNLKSEETFVYEIQKLLNKKGFKVQIDGMYHIETIQAIKSFEQQNNFYPDGKIDLLTLKTLLQD